jgi:hypothetical protein
MKKNMTSLLFWLPYSLFIYFLYHLLVIPALLEYSYLALAGLLLWMAILLFLLKTEEKRQVLVFSFLFLLLSKSFAGVEKIDSLWQTLFAYGFVFVLSFFIARFYGKLSYPAIGCLLLLSFFLHTQFIRSQLPLLTHFAIQWVSEPLYTGATTDFFPIFIQDVNGDGKEDVITLGDAKTNLEDEGKPQLKVEQLQFYAFTWTGKRMEKIPNEKLNIPSIMEEYPLDYAGFPYYVLNDKLQLIPQVQHEELTWRMMKFFQSPFYAMYLNMKNLMESHQKKENIVEDPFRLPDTQYIPADVDGDQNEEFLVSSTPSAIVKPKANEQWDVLWTARDSYFRFENYLSLGEKKEIIALEKSQLSGNPTRYVASFDFSPEGLVRNWKVFVPLNNIESVDIDGDGVKEMAAYDFTNRRILILKKHNLPVSLILGGGLVLVTGILAFRRMKPTW